MTGQHADEPAVRDCSEPSRVRQRYGPWAVVTGASEGIGRACAVALGAAGVNLVLVARREPELEALAALLRSSGVEAVVLAGDVTDTRFTDRLAAKTATLEVGLVVLAAGFGSLGTFVDRDLADEVAMIEVNVVAVARLAHLFAGRLAAQGRGGLILFGSIVAGQGTPLQANYAASKAWVRTFGEALAVELRQHGVDVLVVSPGPVHTGFADRAGMTMPSAADPEVVARAVLRAIGRRDSVIPGVRARLLTVGLAAAPRRLRTRIMRRVMRGMLGPEPPDQRAVAPSGSGGTVRPSSGTESRPGT